MRTLITFLLSAAGLVVLFAGPIVLLPAVRAVDLELGSTAGLIALGLVLLVCAAVMQFLSWLAQRRIDHLEPNLGQTLRDRWFCRTCAAAVPLDEVVCLHCGGTSFAVARPSAVVGEGTHRPAAAWWALPVVLRQRDFRLIWIGQLISVAGDVLLLLALPLFLYDLTGSALATGAMFVAQVTMRLALSALSGVLVDRWDRRRTIVVADLLRAAVLLLLLLVRSVDEMWLIYLVAAINAGLGAFFTSAKSALVPRLVATHQLSAANALIGLTGSMASLVAPLAGGVLLLRFGLPAVVLLDSVSFVLSAIAVACVSLPVVMGNAGATPVVNSITPVALHSNWKWLWRDWLDGLWLIRRQRVLRALFGITGLVHGGMGITAALFVVFMRQVYHGGAVEIGWWLTAQAAGSLVAGAVLARRRRSHSPARNIAAALVIRGTVLLFQINVPQLGVALVLAAVSMAASVVFTVSAETLSQTATADHYRGRVTGALNTTTAMAMLCGMLVASVAGDALNVVPLFHITAMLWLLAGLMAWWMLLGIPVAGGSSVTRKPSHDNTTALRWLGMSPWRREAALTTV